MRDALSYGSPNRICYYEQPLKKLTRQIYAKQWNVVNRDLKSAITGEALRNHIDSLGLSFKYDLRQKNIPHHLSHAAGGYFTSPFRNATVVVIDAIGEWETLTIWKGEGNKLTKLHSQWFPNSIGLWYSAMTQRLGLKPNEEEYILMGMSAFGDPNRFYEELMTTFVKSIAKGKVKFNRNLHRGCGWWKPEGLHAMDIYDVAAATKIEKEHIEAKIWDDKQCPPQRDLDELFATRGIIRASKVVNFSQSG